MDIKSKKSRPFLVWFSFFMGLNIVLSMLILGCIVLSDKRSRDDLIAALRSDVKNMYEFKRRIAYWFDYLAWHITTENADELLNERMNEIDKIREGEHTNYYSKLDKWIEFSKLDKWIELRQQIENEGENLIFYAKNTKTGKVYTNENAVGEHGVLRILQEASQDGLFDLPDEYDYCFYYDGARFALQKDGRMVDIYRRNDEYGYRQYLGRYMEQDWRNSETTPDISGCIIYLVVRDEFKENPYAYSVLYSLSIDANAKRIGFIIAVFVFIIGAGLLILSIIKRKQKQEFDKKLALISGKVWFEIKGFISLILIIFIFVSFYEREYGYFFAAIGFWWYYIMLVDILANRKKFLSNNSIAWLIGKYHAFERKKPFQKAMLLRIYVLIAALAVLVFFAFIFMYMGHVERNGLPSFFAFLCFVIAAYLVYRYVRRYSSTVSDIGRLCDHIKAVKEGDMETKLNLDENADMYPAAQNLNSIQQGISIALEQQLKSERMKVDLVTNVSHDLKTPLTSIISYVDLLSKEDDLPGHVKDYIGVLVQKSQQLKSLINDLFDLSKATSNNIEVQNEKLSLSKLMQQVLADLEENILASGLEFKVSIPQEPVYIISDGAKLHRVFENIITNALKYSLAGTRVYVQLNVEGNKAIATIKNIANYEMDFDEETILQRFTRGDKARTTEGSGLGLAIARHFTAICGGEFRVKIDGDLFKVEMCFGVHAGTER
ncbi:MAG: HAMP domain-containing histidine kinase [Firmicutes bacterium]|nr:HAMP domain-containing histidine kinase [Bacillota bacterium]